MFRRRKNLGIVENRGWTGVGKLTIDTSYRISKTPPTYGRVQGPLPIPKKKSVLKNRGAKEAPREGKRQKSAASTKTALVVEN